MIIKFKLFENVDEKRYPKEDPNGVFVIGDRVVFNTTRFKNREGTVIAFYSDNYMREVLVKLDKKETGDGGYLCKGDNLEDPDDMSYYTIYNNINLIEPTSSIKTRWYKKGKFLEEGIRLIKENWINLKKSIKKIVIMNG